MMILRAPVVPSALLICGFGLGIAPAPTALAEDIFWINPAGGLFQDAANWSRGVPDGNDVAIFQLAEEGYIVSFAGDWQTDRLRVRHDVVTFDLNRSVFLLVNQSQPIIVGETPTNDGTLVVLDGTIGADRVVVGLQNGATGRITLEAGAIGLFDNLTVADEGVGTLIVQNGAQLSGDASSVIAASIESIGSGTVIGADSRWSVGQSITVGSVGEGELMVLGGGEVNTGGRTVLGGEPQGVGTATVSGKTSKLVSKTSVVVGERGEGILLIESGGLVSSTSNSVMAELPLSIATVTVTGSGSFFSSGAQFNVGLDGNATVNLQDSGAITSADRTAIGVSPSGIGSVTISGSGTSWASSDQFRVGQEGFGALTIEQGGSATSLLATKVGNLSGGFGEVTIDGPQSSLFSSSSLEIGVTGDGNLVVLDGGYAHSVGESVIGLTDAGDGNAEVVNAGSMWSTDDDFAVGSAGQGTLLLADGAQISSGLGSFVGRFVGSHGDATVADPDTLWTSGVNFEVGAGGHGTMRIQNSARITVGNTFRMGDFGLLEISLTPANANNVLPVSVNESAVLAGALVIELADGFDPPVGTSFDIIAAGTVVSEFGVVSLPILDEERVMEVTYGDDVVRVDVLAGEGGGGADFGDPEEVIAAGAPSSEAGGELGGPTGVAGAPFPDVIVTIPAEDPRLPGEIQVFLNQGTNDDDEWLGLDPNQPMEVGPNPSAVTLGFFDADPFLDAAVTTAGDDMVWILLNNGLGDGGFVNPFGMPTGSQPSDIATADFDHDGFADLAITNQGDNTVSVIFAPGGDGGNKTLAAGGVMPIGVDVEDLDNDKCTDIVGVNQDVAVGLDGGQGGLGTGNVFVYLNNDGNFGQLATYPAGVDPRDLAVADVDHDGFKDIMVVNGGQGTVSFLINNGDGTFFPAGALPIGSDPRSIHALDIDDDQDADLAIVADDEELGPSVQVLRNIGVVPGEVIFAERQIFTVGAIPNFGLAVDLDRNGLEDLITANDTESGQTGGSVTTLLNSGTSLTGCVEDLDGDGAVGTTDLITLLGAWGTDPGGPPDFDGDGIVGTTDLIVMLGAWGECP